MQITTVCRWAAPALLPRSCGSLGQALPEYLRSPGEHCATHPYPHPKHPCHVKTQWRSIRGDCPTLFAEVMLAGMVHQLGCMLESHWQIQSCKTVSEDVYESGSRYVSQCMLACLGSRVPDKVNCAVSMLVQIGCWDEPVDFTDQASICVLAATLVSALCCCSNLSALQVWDIWNNRDVLAPHWEHSLQVQHPDVRLLISAVAASSWQLFLNLEVAASLF